MSWLFAFVHHVAAFAFVGLRFFHWHVVPVILTSRADSVTTRLASCAVAALVANARREAADKAVG